MNDAVTAMWARDVRRFAKTGDWILTRSYSLTADMIDVASAGPPVAHVAIYDAEQGTVIEAISPRVREVPLEHLLDRNHIAIVVRPAGLTDLERRQSVHRARAMVGAPFDYVGVLGVDTEGRVYCSELALRAIGADLPRVGAIAPSSLVAYGDVVYVSGERDDRRVQTAARRTDSRRARISASALW